MTTKNFENLQPDKPMFPISAVADLLKVHQRTLRIYDEQDILVPTRSPKNRRLYSFNDIEKGKLVQFLSREVGINLAGMKIIFTLMPKVNQLTMDEAVKKLGITPEMMQENRIKSGRKGRKKRS